MRGQSLGHLQSIAFGLSACLCGAFIVGCSGSLVGSQTTSPPPDSTVTISASLTTITLGSSTTITWTSTNATSCTASNAWSGTETVNGSVVETPASAGTSTYTIACTGPGGTATSSVSVTVNPSSTNVICAAPPLTNAMEDWLVQKACVVKGVVQNTDPCSCTGTLRNLAVAEPLPYHKWNQQMTTRHDAFPVVAPSGQALAINDEGTAANTNAYTNYRFDDLNADGLTDLSPGLWASSNGTKDGSGFTQAMWGCSGLFSAGTPTCLPYGGWLFFPQSLFVPNGSGGYTMGAQGILQHAMSDRYWEQSSQSWPGATPVATSYPQTIYTPLTNAAFGGVKDAPSKIIANSIQSVHGYDPKLTNWGASGHLEALYFTQLYGWTRWESWHTVQELNSTGAGGYTSQQALTAAADCNPIAGAFDTNPADSTYGFIVTTFPQVPYTFVMTACADYTAVTTTDADTTPPVWPLPDLNLLSNPHFTASLPGGSSIADWNSSGSISFNASTSALSDDTAFANQNASTPYAGVNYATVRCSSGMCSLYTDISLPVTMPAPASGTTTYSIAFGALAGIDTASSIRTGKLGFEVEQLTSSGVVNPGAQVVTSTANTVFYAAKITSSVLLGSTLVPNTCVAYCDKNGTAIDVESPPSQIAIAAGTTKLRLILQPQAGILFDIPQAWLMQVQ
jgi:hypothetical protein